MCAPSSKIVVDVGGIDPGRMPPMSAWCPRDAVKKMIFSACASNTGEMIVMSGKCLGVCGVHLGRESEKGGRWDVRAACVRGVGH